MLQFITVNMLFNDFVQYKNSEPFITVENDEIKHLQFFIVRKKWFQTVLMFETRAPSKPFNASQFITVNMLFNDFVQYALNRL